MNGRPADYLRAQCAIELTYCRPNGYYALDNLRNRIDTFNEHVEVATRVLGAVRLVTDHATHLLFTQHTRRGDDLPATDAERALLDARLADMEAHPDDQSSWPEVKARLERRTR